jgi:uncharacterized protein
MEDDCACPDGATILTFEHTLAMENDCACPSQTGFARPAPAPGMLYEQTPRTHTSSLPGGFHLAFSPYAPAGPSALNANAWERWQSFREPRPLENPVDETLAKENLIAPLGRHFRLRTSPPETLTAWLHVTNACNLDCPYCYVQKSPEYMPDHVGLEVVNRLIETAQARGFPRLKLKYAGGEPMLHFGLVKKLGQKARALARQMGIELEQVLLSNGTRISSADVDWLLANQCKLMISVDGIGEAHDRMRPHKNGSGTFEMVTRTIDEILLPKGMTPFISITITKMNANSAAETVRWALVRDLPVSLNFYRQPDSRPDQDELALEDEIIIQGMLAAYRVFEEYLPTRPFLNGLLDRAQMNAHLHTCGVGQNYIAISHEGKLAQCQMQIHAPVAQSIQGDLLFQVAGGNIHNISVEEKSSCRDCLYRFRCTGGCPLETGNATGNWENLSPNCKIYQALFPAALHLEGLRLLKCNGYLQ